MLRRLRIILLLLPMLLASCGWQEAKDVIATADSLDQTEHVIYDDTAALGQTIRTLDNPVGRLLMSNTLGKAYYFMGRNYSLSDQIVEAAECYIEADRLQIDDPIYRGRVNSCMGYICAQNDNDSLALIFYERAHEDFVEVIANYIVQSEDWWQKMLQKAGPVGATIIQQKWEICNTWLADKWNIDLQSLHDEVQKRQANLDWEMIMNFDEQLKANRANAID